MIRKPTTGLNFDLSANKVRKLQILERSNKLRPLKMPLLRNKNYTAKEKPKIRKLHNFISKLDKNWMKIQNNLVQRNKYTDNNR